MLRLVQQSRYIYVYQRGTFLLQISASLSLGTAMLVCPLPMKCRKKVGFWGIRYFSHTSADLVCDTTDTDCQEHNGSTHGQFLTNEMRNWMKNCCVCTFFFSSCVHVCVFFIWPCFSCFFPPQAPQQYSVGLVYCFYSTPTERACDNSSVWFLFKWS